MRRNARTSHKKYSQKYIPRAIRKIFPTHYFIRGPFHRKMNPIVTPRWVIIPAEARLIIQIASRVAFYGRIFPAIPTDAMRRAREPIDIPAFPIVLLFRFRPRLCLRPLPAYFAVHDCLRHKRECSARDGTICLQKRRKAAKRKPLSL